MAVHTRAQSFLLFLVCWGLLAVPLAACPAPPLIEEVASDAEFIGRVIPISTIAVRGEEARSERFETRARVVDGVRGAAGVVTLVSSQLLPEQELLVFGRDCGDWCAKRDTYRVNASFALDLATSAARSGDWFEMSDAGFYRADLEALRAHTVQGPEQARQVVSWRALTRMISGAEAFVACREDALSDYGSGCSTLEGADQSDCWQAYSDEFNHRIRACRR